MKNLILPEKPMGGGGCYTDRDPLLDLGALKFAFTLAEVLITLGIIGIVAAITFPQLIKNYQHKVLESQFKKSVSMIYQIILTTKQDMGIDKLQEYCIAYSSYIDENGDSKFKEYLHNKECTDALVKNSFKFKPTDSLNNYHNYRLIRKNEIIKTYSGSHQILSSNYNSSLAGAGTSVFHTNVMPDGSFLNFNIIEIALYITVDINGRKGPNQLGHDIFIFRLNKDDTLGSFGEPKYYSDEELASGKYETEYQKERKGNPCSVKSTQKANGIGCTYYALRDECPDGKGSYFECLPY